MNRKTEVRIALPWSKKILFSVILALASAAFLFGVAELVLRGAGVGHSADFYRVESDEEGKRWIRDNRWFTAPYFSEDLVRHTFPFRIPEEKPKNAYRIFILGSSAAMGDPEASFSISRMLDAMLSKAYPNIEFEVINAAITAINSHVVKKIAQDCAKLDPDLFIVYEGNNEIIGPYGPAAVFTPFLNSPAAIDIRSAINRSRIGQLLSNLGQGLNRSDSDSPAWNGMEMFLEHSFEKDSPKLETARQHFARNLNSIIRSARTANANTFLCTVPVNERDFAPFLSSHDSRLSNDRLKEWNEIVAMGDEAMARDGQIKARQHYLEANAIDDQYASLSFRLGRVQLSLGEIALARNSLKQALDLDTLRFRTDTRLNKVIRKVAEEHGEAAIQLVDLQTLAGGKSEFGIVGDNWFYEHVHLNFRGTFEIANELYRRTSSLLLDSEKIESMIPQSVTIQEMRIHLAYTIYEQAMIISTLLDRFSKPPFTGQMDSNIRNQMWIQRKAAADKILLNPESENSILSRYEQAVQSNPSDWVVARNFGMALIAFKRHSEAIPWLEKAHSAIDDDADTLFALATAHKSSGNRKRANEFIMQLTKIEPNYPGLKQLKTE